MKKNARHRNATFHIWAVCPADDYNHHVKGFIQNSPKSPSSLRLFFYTAKHQRKIWECLFSTEKCILFLPIFTICFLSFLTYSVIHVKKLIITNLLLDCDPQIHTWVLSYTISHVSTGAIFQYKGKSILTGLSDTIFSLQINFITYQIILVDF